MPKGSAFGKTGKIAPGPAAVLLCCLLLTACGVSEGQAGPSAAREDETEGMAHVCLYADEEYEKFDSDTARIEERVAALSEGRYSFERTAVGVYDREGNLTEDSYPAVDFYFPQEVCGDHSLVDIIKYLISRPVDLWIGSNTGTGKRNTFEETLPLSRDDIVSAAVMEGCPSGLNPFDYGITEDSFLYVEIMLSETFCEENPQIRDWKTPGFIHDGKGFDGYYSMDAVPAGDGQTFYLLLPDEKRGFAEALAYDYTHEPLTEGFYILDMPEILWEEPDSDSGTRQISNSDFTDITAVYVYEMEEKVCTDENWEKTLQAVRNRLETLHLDYAVGRLAHEEHSIAVRIEHGPGVDELAADMLAENSTVSVKVLGNETYLELKNITAAVEEKDGRHVLSLDMSATSKDIFNKLTSLSENPAGDRMTLCVDFQPFMWTDFHSVIRDGRVTMDYNAFTGEAGFEEKDRFLLDYVCELINGDGIPESYYGSQLVTLNNTEFAFLDREGNFCQVYGNRLDYSGYYSKLDEMAAPFAPLASGNNALSGYILQFSMPEGDESDTDTAGRIAEQVSQMIPVFRDDIFMTGMIWDWTAADESTVRIGLSGSIEDYSLININIYVSGNATQETADAVAEALRSEEALQGVILINSVNVY